ncbi:TIGR03546 family protein [Spirochaeta isovalerica]|uniref:Uncharacterized protein (TIGR03546 family) n=1 Tax=Spirochaeta isovalerica TaxID=150 RepID=A0A841R8I2_9SPIO|nr:TIGR03546 family protein [Spirochaeta isovalerica]MBB6479340.1 uncharacterized protein (TIGR03546 family) [Spirochaeta isovalerica]
MIGFIAKILVALNSNSRPGELASGLSFGLWLSLVPGGNLLWFVLFAVAFFLKHNTAAFLLSMAGFRLIVPIADPLLDKLGELILTQPGLQVFYTFLYNLPFMSYSSFNNTIVAGGFLSGLILWVPLFYLFLFMVKLYRRKIAPKIAESKAVKALKKVPFFSKLASAVRLEAGL